jgi:hypothetical protein
MPETNTFVSRRNPKRCCKHRPQSRSLAGGMLLGHSWGDRVVCCTIDLDKLWDPPMLEGWDWLAHAWVPKRWDRAVL